MVDGEKRPTVYFSNQLEQLAKDLGKALFQKGGDPFAKRLVLLPHHSLKSYLSFFFASQPDWTLLAGVQFQTVFEGIFELVGEKNISSTALALLLEKKVEEKQPSFSEEKVRWTAKEMAKLFSEARLFEPRAVSLWLSLSGWKQEIYLETFGSLSIEDLLHSKELGKEVHLFGFSFLQPHFLEFFTKNAANFYFLSPTPMFWEDLCSDRERVFLEKKMVGKKVQLQVQEQLSFFLKKRNPLLANFGRVGRSLLRYFGEIECFLEEGYHPPQGKTALACLQRSLFALDEEKKSLLEESDTSLLIVSASSKLREVESLLETLQTLMQKETVEPKNVLVLCPSLETYAPYIEAVFGRGSSPFSYSMHGVSPLFAMKKAREIFAFLELIEGRFSLQSFVSALPSFMEKWDFQEKEVESFALALEKVHVLWGLNKEHQKGHLLATLPEGKNGLEDVPGRTLLEGMEKLFLSLAKEKEEPLIRWTEVEAFGKLAAMLELLEEKLRPIYQRKKKTFQQWHELLVELLERFLPNSNAMEGFFQEIEHLRKELGEERPLLSFAHFKELLCGYFQQGKESVQSGSIQAVKFLSLEPGGVYPADIICVLGADEETIAKEDLASSLDEFQEKKTPLQSEEMRYLFLQLLLHARVSLVFSYERVSSLDGKEQPLSRFVEEIFSYVDTFGFFENQEKKPSEVFRRDHPAVFFSKEYFTEKSPLFSHSLPFYFFAKSYYAKEKGEKEPFLVKTAKEAPDTLDIRQIENFARQPLFPYFKETLGITYPFSSDEEKEFFLSPKDKGLHVKKSLQSSLEEGKKPSKEQGIIPPGLLGEVGKNELKKDIEVLQSGLELFGLEETELFLLEFVPGLREVEKVGKKILFPPLEVDVEGKKVKIVGQLYPVSDKGIVFFGKEKDVHLFWPLWLIYLISAPKAGLSSSALFIKEQTEKTNGPKNPQKWLSSYLKLYFQALKEPFLRKTVNVVNDFSSYMDPYDKFVGEREEIANQQELIESSRGDWEEAFAFFHKKEEGHA